LDDGLKHVRLSNAHDKCSLEDGKEVGLSSLEEAVAEKKERNWSKLHKRIAHLARLGAVYVT
jgi:hypothetical protein